MGQKLALTTVLHLADSYGELVVRSAATGTEPSEYRGFQRFNAGCAVVGGNGGVAAVDFCAAAGVNGKGFSAGSFGFEAVNPHIGAFLGNDVVGGALGVELANPNLFAGKTEAGNGAVTDTAEYAHSGGYVPTTHDSGTPLSS